MGHCYFVPCSKALGTPPRRQRLCRQSAHLWATAGFVPHSKALWTPDGRGYVANLPTCWPLLIFSPALKVADSTGQQRSCSQSAHYWATSDFLLRFEGLGTPWTGSQSAHLWATPDFLPRFEGLETLDGRGYVANLPTCGPLLVLSPAPKHCGPPRRQGLCSQSAHLWAIAGFVPHSKALWTPDGRGYVANLPTCWPLLIFSPALKVADSTGQQRSCSQSAHYWATSDFLLRFEGLGTPWTGSQSAHLWATPDFLPRFEGLETPDGRGYVANLHTCGPLLVLSPAPKHCGPPRRQGLCSQSAHLWAIAGFVPHPKALWTPDGRGYVANLPTCWPLLVFSPALKVTDSREPPRSCSQSAHYWATSDFLLRFEGLGTPWTGSQSAHLWATPDFLPRFEGLETPDGKGYVANLPTCGPLLVLSPALKDCGPPDGRGYVANLPICGQLLVLSPTPKHCGPQTVGVM